MQKLPLCFQVLDETGRVETEPLAAQVRLDELLPALRVLDDAVTGIAVRKDGHPVTCAKGCSMCCRIQLVPVTPAEAYALLWMTESMPEERRAEIRARFEDRVARLEQAGLAEFFRETDSLSTAPGMREQMPRYLELGLACPFLEGDVCGIYESRPFACREFLVTTPKEECATPLSGSVRTVPKIFFMGLAAVEAGASLGARGRMVPLILALEYAEEHRAELEREYPSGQVLAESIRQVFVMGYRQGSLTI